MVRVRVAVRYAVLALAAMAWPGLFTRPRPFLGSVLCHQVRSSLCSLTCNSAASGDEKQGPYAGNSFLISCPLLLVFEIFSFRFIPLPFSLLLSLSLLFGACYLPSSSPPWAVGSPSQTNQVTFSFFCGQRVLQLVPATAAFHTAKTDDVPPPPWERLTLFNSTSEAVH
jgi:hypothetical protein